MGAKAPEKLKLRGPACEVCGRRFHNKQALASHAKFMHKNKTITNKRVAFKRQKVKRRDRAVKKNDSTPPISKNTSETQTPPVPPVVDKNVEKPAPKVSVTKKPSSMRKIEFKCPKCVRIFTVYFSAFRHIQKYHCIDDNEQPVAPNSPHLIKPIRVEQCVFCKDIVTSTDNHKCYSLLDCVGDNYMCLGCQQTFDSLALFGHHVKGVHGNDLESYFFPTLGDFKAWKSELQSVSKTKFVSLTPKSKMREIYHCSYQPSMETDKTLLCPSSINVTDFRNGKQVFYYKQHFGHTCLELPPDRYKKYTICPALKETDVQLETEDHVYEQFKNIMNSITVGAARVDVGVLNTLLEKAFEMSMILNSIGHEDEQSVVNKSMTDEQITEVLAEVKTFPSKRKAAAVKKSIKKITPLQENNENSEANLAVNIETEFVNQTSEKKTEETLPTTPLPRPFLQSSPSFNDTYKDFVDQTFKTLSDTTCNSKKTPVKKKVIMKTKIGQFKVRPSLSPKTITPVKLPTDTRSPTPSRILEYKIRPDIEYEVKEQENDCNILILKI